MTTLQRSEYFFELVNDSVMTRTMEGMIEFWNRSAEKLYGWRKEEAVGRVSHELLQTRFPQPLEEIESEVIRNGRWEGKLVHTTRDGSHVVVQSRWTLEFNGQPGALVEINTPSIDPESPTNETMPERRESQTLLEQKVTTLQPHEYFLELVNDSVMTRTMDGMINFWNRSAERLYGWRTEEAIGKVSHNLLQTQFPEPLEKIESELIRNGRWEGKLVHTTRDGGRVAVQSRWTLDLTKQPGAVIEINARAIDSDLDSEAHTDRNSVEIGRQEPVRANNNLLKAGDPLPNIAKVLVGGTFLCMIAVLIYGLFGHGIIKAIYDDRFLGIGKWLMQGKAITSLQNYYSFADSLILLWILRLIIFIPLVVVFLKKPLGALLASCSTLLFSFFLFSVLEFFPSLVTFLHLDILPFYSYRQANVTDDALVFRMRPFFHNRTYNFKGDLYSPAYGIDVPPEKGEEVYDENGFKNSHATDFSDIVVLGDSYVTDGTNVDDPFPQALGRNLPGLTVANLGTAGYGPHQYIEVLKRYGINMKPKYVLLAFFEGNDIENILSYLRWKEGRNGGESYARVYDALSAKTLPQRYAVALKQSLDYGRKRMWQQIWPVAQLLFDRADVARQRADSVHPAVTILRLGNNNHKVILPITNGNSKPTEEMLKSEEFRVLEQILADFKDLCVQNNIVPIILYIPTAVHIYAEYSTQDSGSHWLRMRSEQIATKENMERAVRDLSQKLDIDFITLSPIFERAAKEGKLLYYPLDSHWNSVGKEVAARFVADMLKSKFIGPANELN